MLDCYPDGSSSPVCRFAFAYAKGTPLIAKGKTRQPMGMGNSIGAPSPSREIAIAVDISKALPWQGGGGTGSKRRRLLCQKVSALIATRQ